MLHMSRDPSRVNIPSWPIFALTLEEDINGILGEPIIEYLPFSNGLWKHLIFTFPSSSPLLLVTVPGFFFGIQTSLTLSMWVRWDLPIIHCPGSRSGYSGRDTTQTSQCNISLKLSVGTGGEGHILHGEWALRWEDVSWSFWWEPRETLTENEAA